VVPVGLALLSVLAFAASPGCDARVLQHKYVTVHVGDAECNVSHDAAQSPSDCSCVCVCVCVCVYACVCEHVYV